MFRHNTDRLKILGFLIVCLVIFNFLLVEMAYAQAPTIKLPDITLGTKEMEGGDELSILLQLAFALSTLSLAPYILVMATAFIRVTIVLSFIRSALGTQQIPPTQVLMGLALFITFYIMAPVGEEINKTALTPLMKKEINTNQFMEKAMIPIRDFLLRQTRDKDLKLFVRMARKAPSDYKTREDLPIYVILPAFVVSEVKTSFQIGFCIYLPFLVIDMVVASVLMSMGMFMLSPMQISMPFKLLMFVMIDGWGLIIENLVKSFNVK